MNSKSQCVFLSANATDMKRKPEFRTVTEFWQDNGKRFVIKKAANDKSKPFLRDMVKKDKFASDFFGNHAKVLIGELRGSTVYYPYLAGSTLEEILCLDIGKGDSDFGRSHLQDYIQFLERLPSKTCVPKDFCENLSISPKQFSKPVRCLCFAPFDCIPRNIIVKDDIWQIFDNEWTYSFPLPIDFLKYRGIRSLIMGLQPKIQSAVSSEKPVVLFCGFGKNRYYMPLSWLDFLRDLELPVKQLNRWSIWFQNNITIARTHSYIRLKEKPRKLMEVVMR